MLLVSDIHGAAEALKKVAASDEPLLVLGDLVNLIDYRTGEGIVADVVGVDLVKRVSVLRFQRRRSEANDLWHAATAGRMDEINAAIGDLMAQEYREVCGAIEGADAYVTYGNVDRPDMLKEHLPSSARYLDGEACNIEGVSVGFAGGGIPRIGTAGEVDPVDMASKLDRLGPVDILCTHVPPDIAPLASDVVGRNQKASKEILEYLKEHRPAFHFFGDIHQPQATTWQVGATTCINVGYFRATGIAYRHVT